MKLRKLLAVTAVAATMTAAFAVSAMAETTNNLVSGTDFTYDAKTGIITLTTDKQPSAAPYTMLVVASDEDDLDKTIADTDIKQIDQADAPFTTINVGDLTVAVEDCETCSAVEGKETCTCTHTYEIRLGGDGQVRWGTLTIEPESTGSEYYDDGTVLLGDANCNNDIAIDDVLIALKYTSGTKDISKDATQAIDANENGDVAIDDVLIILKYTSGDRSVLGTKTIAEKEVFVPIVAQQ